ncbi:hypothetical protein [Paraburkholderia sp. RL18-085-BIA-A]
MRYTFNAGMLLLKRKITWQTFKYAMLKRPVAVAGPRGGYIVDPDFE